MTAFVRFLSASFLGICFSGATFSDPTLVLLAFASALIPEVLPSKRLRDIAHGLVGLIIIGTLVFIMLFINTSYALALVVPHIFNSLQYLIMENGAPLLPLDDISVSLLGGRKVARAVFSFLIFILFAFLWIAFLSVQNLR